MRAFALLYLTIVASVALAAPAPVPVPQEMGDIVESLPENDPNEQLGPSPGTGKRPPCMGVKSRLSNISTGYNRGAAH